MQQRVLQGAIRIACGRMHHQAGRFIHYQQIIILIHQFHGDRLRRTGYLGLKNGTQQQMLAGEHPVPWPPRSSIDQHPALANPLLQAAAGIVAEHHRQHLVQALA